VFEQFAQALRAEVPHVTIEGGTYPPPRFNEILSSVIFYARISIFLLLIAGPGALQSLGIQNPPWVYTWAMENKVII